MVSYAFAGPTGLALMPIADVLKHREAMTELSLAGVERNVSRATEYGQALTIGLWDRLEVGFESDFRGETTANVKFQLFEGPKFLPNTALSVGVTNWRGDVVDPYVVGRLDGKGYRLHAGYWRTLGADRLAIGSDFPVGGVLVGSIEHLTGRGGATWAEMTYAFERIPGLELGVAVGVPNLHEEGLQHEVTLAYAFKF